MIPKKVTTAHSASEDTQHCPVTELLLKVDSHLLILLTPYHAKNAWWRDRAGILKLQPDGRMLWFSECPIEHDGGRIPGEWGQPTETEYPTAPVELSYKKFSKDTMQWHVFLASCKKGNQTWYEWNTDEWRHEPHGVIFSVENRNLTLGGTK
jgi:hypothetical protein